VAWSRSSSQVHGTDETVVGEDAVVSTTGELCTLACFEGADLVGVRVDT